MAGADAVGMNCTIGPQETLDIFIRVAGTLPVPALRDAERRLPEDRLTGATVYLSSPDYLREVARDFVTDGRRHRRRLLRHDARAHRGDGARGRRRRSAFVAVPYRAAVEVERSSRPAEAPLETSRLKRKLADPASFVVTAEVEPPKGTDVSSAVEGARRLKALGVDGVNVTDNPMARLRMSSIAVAHLVQTETGAETSFRSPRATATFSGSSRTCSARPGLGIKALLVVGGDPLKIGDYPQAKPVCEVDTFGLLRIVKGLNAGVDLAGNAIGTSTSFAIACAANPAAADLEVEISKLSAKIEAGATFAQTQPVYDLEALDRFFERQESRAIPILVGLIPPKSAQADPLLRERGSGHGRPSRHPRPDAEGGGEGARVRGRGRARDRRELARVIRARARGIHIMPMARYDSVARILDALGLGAPKPGAA